MSILSNCPICCSDDMPEKKRSREEFEAYLKAQLNQAYPKVKYQSPDAWRIRALKGSKKR